MMRSHTIASFIGLFLIIVQATSLGLKISSAQAAGINQGTVPSAFRETAAETSTMIVNTQIGPLQADVEQRGTSNYPMDGVKARMLLTNTSTAPISFQVSAVVKETGELVVHEPQPGLLQLASGESRTLSCTLGGGLSSLPNGVASTRTVVWSLGGYGTLETPLVIVNWGTPQGTIVSPPAGQGMTVSVHVQDEKGIPLNAYVMARAGGNVSFVPSGQAGDFTATLPPSTNWIVSASASGRRTAYLPLTEVRDYPNQVLTLTPQKTWFTYQPARTLETGIGPWLARVDGAEDAILVTAGMEHWSASMQPFMTQAKLRLYSTTGQKQWEYALGHESWFADLSRDGHWAATVTVQVPEGNKLTLLDARTGQVVWQRTLDTTMIVREIRFAPDGESFAIGSSDSVMLINRTNPNQAVWTAILGGQVRAIRFSADGQTLYASAGSGVTVAFRAAEGTELWRAVTYAWVHPEGLALSPDETKLGVVSSDGDVMMFEAATGCRLWYRDTRQKAWFASFSGDGTVFLAGIQTGSTLGLVTDTGEPIFNLMGGKGGGFATGQNHFLNVPSKMSSALYDKMGTQISDFITGLENSTFFNWQVAWVSPDGRSIFMGEQQSESMDNPVLFYTTGQQAFPGYCPTISSISPLRGPIGCSVSITGTNLDGITLKFANNILATVTTNTSTSVTATIPNGAITGHITIGKTNCVDVQTGASFTIGPTQGDLSGDCTVDLSDTVLALQILAGINSDSKTINANADVNGDGKIGLQEVIYILQKVAEVR